MDIGKNVKERREQAKLTQKELAEISEVHNDQVISRIERGQTKEPSLQTLMKLAVALNCTVDDLIYDEHTRGPDRDFQLLFEKLRKASPERRDMAMHFLKTLVIAETSDELNRTK